MKCDSGVGAFEKAHAFNEIFGERPKTFHSLSRQAGHLRSAAGNSGHVVNTFVRNECAVHIKRDESDILDRELCGKPQTVDRFSLSLRPKKAILLAPTFGEYHRALEGVDCQIEEVHLSRKNGFVPDQVLLEAIVPGVELVFLCDPNNPTGRLMEEELLYQILARCRQVGAMLAVDQCFLELTAARPARLTDQLAGGNLILFRALTKSYALAGLRLGCCLCGDRALLEQMARILQPWPVSIPAQIAGECALQSFPRWPFTCFPEIERERDRLQAALEELGLWVCPSESCFLLFCGPEDLGKRLRENGILVRDCANYAGLGPGWYRAGLRTPEENGRLIAALSTLLRGE